MLAFVLRTNIRRFEAMLAGPLAAPQRRVVEVLLAAERARLAALLGPPQGAADDIA